MVFGFHLLAASFGYERLPWEGLFPGTPESRSFYLMFPLSYGSAGVAVFFVISGFCIHLNYMRNRECGWRPFFLRRFFRIYPPYVVAVLFFFFFWGWSQREDAVRQLCTHVLGIHNLDERTVFGISPAFWSIGVEIQLYLIYPLLVAVAGAVGWGRALGLTAALEGLLRLVMAGQVWAGHTALPYWIGMSPLYFWFSWAMGAYLAECFLEERETWLARAPAFPILGVALAGSWFKPLECFQFTAWALLTAVAVQRFMTKKWRLPDHGVAGLAWRHLGVLGVVSYSFYLLHQTFMGWTWQIGEMLFPGREVHPLGRFVLGLFWYPVIFLISWFYFLALEKPSIALGKNFLKRVE